MRDSKIDTDQKNSLLDSVGESEGGIIWRIALKHVYYHMWNRWPVQARFVKQGTESWCTRTSQRDGMGREVGGAFGMGGHMYTCDWFMSMYGKNHNIVK